jgi:hypothetical protein
MTAMMWAAVAIVLGQGLILAVGLRVVRTFGAYTEVLLQTHQENLLIQADNLAIADRLALLRPHSRHDDPPSQEDLAS